MDHAQGTLQAEGVVLSVHQDHDGQWQAICDVDGRWGRALTGARAPELIGHTVSVVYSRIDADGGLREARIAAVPVRS